MKTPQVEHGVLHNGQEITAPLGMSRTPLPEDGISTNVANSRGYFLTPAGLRRIKAAAAFAGLRWQAEAARPRTAKEFLDRVEPEMNA